MKLWGDLNVEKEERNVEQRAQFIMDSLEIFERRASKDYHAQFNHNFFIQWIENYLFI